VLENAAPPQTRIEALWRWRLDSLDALAASRYVSPYTRAMHHVVLGEDEQAMAQLERAYDERAPLLVLLPTDPLFERLRGSPRFSRLLAQIKR